MFNQKIIKLSLFIGIISTSEIALCSGYQYQYTSTSHRHVDYDDDEYYPMIVYSPSNGRYVNSNTHIGVRTRQAPASKASKLEILKPKLATYDNVEAKCAICLEDFTVGDRVSMWYCDCNSAYHHECIQRHINNDKHHDAFHCEINDPRCPWCRQYIPAYTNLPWRLFEELENEGLMSRTDANSLAASKKLAKYRAIARTPMSNTITECLAAFVLGCAAEHLWSTKQLSKTQKGLGFAGISASFLALQKMVTAKNLDNVTVKQLRSGTLSWIAGASLGFIFPMLCRQIESKSGWSNGLDSN